MTINKLYRIWHKPSQRFIEDDTDIHNTEWCNVWMYALTFKWEVAFFESSDWGMDVRYKEDCEVIFNS